MSHQPDNIFAGTQVVSLVEVRGTNNSLVHQIADCSRREPVAGIAERRNTQRPE
jgi:hypothetical protein